MIKLGHIFKSIPILFLIWLNIDIIYLETELFGNNDSFGHFLQQAVVVIGDIVFIGIILHKYGNAMIKYYIKISKITIIKFKKQEE